MAAPTLNAGRSADTAALRRLAVAAVLWIVAYAVNARVWDLVVHDLIGLDPASRLGSAVHFFLYDTAKILLLLVGLVFVISMVRTALPNERIRDVILARPPAVAYLLAAAFGALTPFCSCSSVPLFIGFVAAGVPFGINITFLITSPLINQVGVVMLAGLMGTRIAVLYVVTGMALAIVAGWTLARLGADRWLEGFLQDIRSAPVAIDVARPGAAVRIADARAETGKLLRAVWPYLLVGIGVGAAIHGWVPDDFFTSTGLADSPFAVPLATLAGIPLYTNAAGVVPLVEALTSKGVGLGTAMAFMMSVVALSLPSLILLKRVMQTRLLVVFTAVVTLGIIIIGLLFDAIP